MTIFTIGYEGLDINTFIRLLTEHEVDTVVDVRQFPLSRKPGFSKTALSNALTQADLKYTHIVKLGCPKPVRDRYRANGNWNQYTRDFLKHLKLQKDAISELSTKSKSSKCALVCYEADYNFCHRSMVANAVQKISGARVKHIKREDLKTTKLASTG